MKDLETIDIAEIIVWLVLIGVLVLDGEWFSIMLTIAILLKIVLVLVYRNLAREQDELLRKQQDLLSMVLDAISDGREVKVTKKEA